VGGIVPLRREEGRPKAVRDKVAGKGQQQYYWTEEVQVTNTDDKPDLPSEGAPDIDKTVNVKQKLISGHEPQMGLETKTYWSIDRRSQCDFDFSLQWVWVRGWREMVASQRGWKPLNTEAEIRCQETANEDIEDFVRAVMICYACRLVTVIVNCSYEV
jgi:hypothetical protein